jgi:hypothetical protein
MKSVPRDALRVHAFAPNPTPKWPMNIAAIVHAVIRHVERLVEGDLIYIRGPVGPTGPLPIGEIIEVLQ